jgi:RHS repeat-associated protein
MGFGDMQGAWFGINDTREREAKKMGLKSSLSPFPPFCVTDPAGNTTSYTYDGNGNIITVTDAKGQVFAFEYDNMDRRTSQTDPLGRKETYTYNANGNVASVTDAKGQTTTFTYDAADRLIKVLYPDGSAKEYVHDAAGRVSAIKDSVSGIITYTYDILDRVTTEITPTGAVQYEYDILGRRTAMSATGQEKVTYSYDLKGSLTGISQGSTSITLTRDKLGRRTGIAYPNNVATTYTRDASGRLTNLNNTAIASTVENIGLTYDNAGNVIKKSRAQGTEELPAAVTNTVTGDNQITASAKGSDNISYTYDANGNLTSKTDSKGTTSYTWDARNRLIAINGPGLTASFKYDALNRRTEKTINGKTTNYLYDGLDIIQEQENGAVKANYLRTLRIDEVLMRTDATGSVRFYQHDQLGSTVALTDENGIVKTVYSYDPFGNTTVTGEPIDQPFQYTGRENDGTGLYYYRARYYSPEMQRFISKDPVGLAGGINYYAYVGNNPVNWIDPLGLYTFADFVTNVTTGTDLVYTMVTIPGGGTALTAALVGIYADAVGFNSVGFPQPVSDALGLGSGIVGAGAAYVGGSYGSVIISSFGLGYTVGTMINNYVIDPMIQGNPASPVNNNKPCK